MTAPLQSPTWYRVADLRPRLRSHAQIHRQSFRGQVWYVLQDQASGRFHRFTPAAHLVISLMDGHRSVQEIWDLACGQLGDEVLTQEQVIQLLAQLYRGDVLHGDVPPDMAEASDRSERMRRRKLVMTFLNPLAVRIPVLDPDRFLSATSFLVRPFFSWFGVLLILGLIGTAAVLAVMHWGDLTENVVDRVLAAESLILILVAYPLVKALHELGHGYAVKHWGGEVHEMGLMFLVFMPVPYVDASASSAFRQKWRRALVGAAGIIVELMLASLALLVWLNAEPGLVRVFAFNVMLIGGVSTLLFNGNPLLRFDGYYVFADLVGIPNLGVRSNRYLGYLIQRYLFGVLHARSPVSAPGEAAWFLVYGIAAFVYRLFIMVAIVFFVAGQFFVVGVLLAIWACLLMYVLPLLKGLRFLATSPALAQTRGRAVAACLAVVGAVAALFFALPLPHATIAEGVVWVPGEGVVHANSEGTVVEILARPNQKVAAGEPLLRMEDPLLTARLRVLEAEVRELRLRFAALHMADRAEAKIIQEQLRHAEADLDLNRRRAEGLLVRSPTEGFFFLPRARDLPGRFLPKGTQLAYVVEPGRPLVRVLVPQDVIDLVRQRTQGVAVRLADRLPEVFEARIEREVPAASSQLPSAALSTQGGGDIALDPSTESGQALESYFQFELSLDRLVGADSLGERAYVRFDHGSEPLAARIYRGLRQLFLRQFHV